MICGYTDASYTQHPDTRKGSTRNAITLNDAPVISRSITQTMVKLSVMDHALTFALKISTSMKIDASMVDAMKDMPLTNSEDVLDLVQTLDI